MNTVLLGYECEYLQRTRGKVDGCATFYKKDKFRLEEARQVHYYQEGSSLTNRDNVGLILRLSPNSGQEGFCVANTHLLYNPKRGDIKLLQLVKLMAELDHMVPNFQSNPVILCGDFNARPHSFMYKFISQGYLRYHGLQLEDISAQRHGGGRKFLDIGLIPSNLTISDQCRYLEDHHVEMLRRSPVLRGQFHSYQSSPYHHFHYPQVSQNSGFLWHKFHMVSTYKHFIERTGEPEVTTQSNAADSSVVDYVFYSVDGRESKSRRGNFNNRNVIEGRIKLLGRLGLLSQREIKSVGNLPNFQNPSDHMPLLVKFLLTWLLNFDHKFSSPLKYQKFITIHFYSQWNSFQKDKLFKYVITSLSCILVVCLHVNYVILVVLSIINRKIICLFTLCC